MQDFRKLLVWKKAHQFTLAVYRVTKSFPPDERYGLISQIRRSSSSIPTNIAEGTGRGSDGDFLRFLYYAMGSASEAEYQLELAKELNYLSTVKYQSLNSNLVEIKKMLNSLMKRLKANGY